MECFVKIPKVNYLFNYALYTFPVQVTVTSFHVYYRTLKNHQIFSKFNSDFTSVLFESFTIFHIPDKFDLGHS